jgi:hypothetical protein
MKSLIVSTLVISLSTFSVALAGGPSSNSDNAVNSNSTSLSAAGAQSGSVLDLTQNSTTPANTSASLSEHYSGSYSLNNVPDQATLINTPTAPCVVTGGATVSVAGFGLGGSGGIIAQSCVSMEQVRMAYDMRQPLVASNMFCIDSETYRNARALSGSPCPVQSYPKNQQDEVNIQQTQAGYISSPYDSKQESQVNTPAAPVIAQNVANSKADFCKNLNPNDPEDRAYITNDCK